MFIAHDASRADPLAQNLSEMQIARCACAALGLLGFICIPYTSSESQPAYSYILARNKQNKHTFLGLLAKIKRSICSLEFDNSNGGHCPPCYLTYFPGGLPNSDACIAGLAAWPWHYTTALAEHPLNKLYSTFQLLLYPHCFRAYSMLPGHSYTSAVLTQASYYFRRQKVCLYTNSSSLGNHQKAPNV